MICDLADNAFPRPARTDVCIVGAGAAGITLAVELARSGKTVTLLEGGGRIVEEASQRPYLSEILALPHRGLHAGRVRALGGTTTSWGGQIVELDALDFELRSWIPESGWPISKTDLDAYYLRALQLEGIAGAILDDDSVWARVGEPRPGFDDLSAYLSRWCPEPQFAKLHQDVLARGLNIQVWLHANAIDFLLEMDTMRGVRCRSLNGIEAVFSADEYCFCMGAIESSRFFLQPRFERLPWNRSGLLGLYFQDHIDCDAATVLPHSQRFHDIFDGIFLEGYKYNPNIKMGRSIQGEMRLLNAGATFYSTSDVDKPLARIKETAKYLLRGKAEEISAGDLWTLVRHSPTLLRQTYSFSLKHRAYHPRGAQIKMRVHCEQQPNSESAISLSSEKDELGLFRTQLSWRISDLEVTTIRRFVEITRRSLSDIALITPNQNLFANNDSFKASCQDSFHHMGGMRMHPCEKHGVVDPDLKLNGVKNAYICSSAVFPSSGFSNPTHTLLALAIRLADHLAR